MLGRCRQYGDPRLLEVTEERNGPSGLRDDDDDDDDFSLTNQFIQPTSMQRLPDVCCTMFTGRQCRGFYAK